MWIRKELDPKIHWRARICLLAVPTCSNLNLLLDLGDNSPKIPEETWKYWERIDFANCISGEEVFMPFGIFSDPYRSNSVTSPWELRSNFGRGSKSGNTFKPRRSRRSEGCAKVFSFARHPSPYEENLKKLRASFATFAV